ncbi:MAG: hypothetical protein JO194_07670 [Candidatus Eremiobacteraeota bacterium]|nr:hypothetical protein [Candidatus Eremiobacteraeota bacterium]
MSAKLRNLVFALSPGQLKLTPLPNGVWAGSMEFWVSDHWVALVAIADGTTSLHFGSGGGVIGSGGHAAVREAGTAFLVALDAAAPGFTKTQAHPLPPKGRIHFYGLTTDGICVSRDLVESDIARLPDIAPLYAAGQQLIAQIRLANPKRG